MSKPLIMKVWQKVSPVDILNEVESVLTSKGYSIVAMDEPKDIIQISDDTVVTVVICGYKPAQNLVLECEVTSDKRTGYFVVNIISEKPEEMW